MTTDEQVREVYAHFGLAVYLGQVLEHALVIAMVMLKLPHRDRLTKQDIDAFMDQQFAKTLGKLIKNLRTQTTLPSDLEGLLAQALKTRNWLCHDYFRERAVEFMTDAGREKMLAELGEARDLLDRAEKQLSAVVQPLAERSGFTEAKFQQYYEEFRRDHGIGD